MSDPSSPRLIIGLGTGRCGTHSLADLFAEQPATSSHHQPKPCLPWHTDFGWYSEVRKFIERQAEPTVALVGWYYLNYVDLFVRDFDVRVVSLRRDRQQTIESIARLTQQFDHWSNRPPGESATTEFRILFPHYDVADKAEALGCYYDEYYERTARLAEDHPDRVRQFATDDLNADESVGELLRFAGYGDDAVIRTEIRSGLMTDYRWRPGPR